MIHILLIIQQELVFKPAQVTSKSKDISGIMKLEYANNLVLSKIIP